MLYKYIGKQIQLHRKNLHLTQAQLSEGVGISLSFLGHIERGTRKLSVDTLFRIASALNCSADELMGLHVSDAQQNTVKELLRYAAFLAEQNENMD